MDYKRIIIYTGSEQEIEQFREFVSSNFPNHSNILETAARKAFQNYGKKACFRIDYKDENHIINYGYADENFYKKTYPKSQSEFFELGFDD